jgi:hypothetical protein
MTLLVDADGDRVTIAELEAYGLSIRGINALEEQFGLLYVDELQGVGKCDLECGKRFFGPCGIVELRRALRAFFEGRPVKTVEECVAFSHGDP